MSLTFNHQSAPFSDQPATSAGCSVTRLNGKAPRLKAAQFQPAILYRKFRNYYIRRRVSPITLVIKDAVDKSTPNKLPRRKCFTVALAILFCVAFNLSSSLRAIAAEEPATNSAPAVAVDPKPDAAKDKADVPTAAALTPATNGLTVALEIPKPASESAPGLGELPLPSGLQSTNLTTSNEPSQLQQFQILLDLGRQQRREKDFASATKTLAAIVESNSPPDFKRPALFELALVAQDDGKFVKAQQIFAQYLHVYPNDPSVPEVLLRQGLVYRQMGVTTLAISKFYAVMSSALKLKLDNMDYYKKLVLQAQLEIADTYYMEGRYEESADFFNRLLKSGAPGLNLSQLQFKLVRSLSFLPNQSDTIAKAQVFLDLNTNSLEVPEVRFLLASALKKLGRNHEAMKQVLLLLQSQQENVCKNPDVWIYWQQKAGNDIANQLYKEGDYLNALQIYLGLADLDHSPAWQLPVWYQSGLVYEQLQQPVKAGEMYQHILDRQKELTDANSSPTLQSLIDMSKWRKDYLDWMQKAKTTNQAFQSGVTNSVSAVAAK